MKKVWMFLAAFALIAAVPSCGDSDEPVTPPHQEENTDPTPGPGPVAASFSLTVSNVTASDFSLEVTPHNYTGNYYVAAVSGADDFTGEEIAEILITQDIEGGVDLGEVDDMYIYDGPASIPSMGSLWRFASSARVTVVVFGLSAEGEILTDVATEYVQLEALSASDFVISVGEITSTTAKVSVSGTPGNPFYLGVFSSSDIAGFETSELADAIIDTYGDKILENVFALPDGQTSGIISYSGLRANTNYTVVLFGFDPEALSATSQTVTTTFVTSAAAGGEEPTGEFGTITVSNVTDTTMDFKVEPQDLTTPYLISVEYADYVNDFQSDSELFANDMAFFYNEYADYLAFYDSVYALFLGAEILDTGVVEDQFSELDPGTDFCIYAYHMNAEETLTTTISKVFFKTTGTAVSSVSTKSPKTKKARLAHGNYVERPAECPARLGAASVQELSLPQACQFGKR